MAAHYFTVDEAVQRLRNEGLELELDAFESVNLEELARVRGTTVTIQGKTFFAYTNDIHDLLSAVRLHLQHGQRSDLTPKKDCDSMMVLLTREHMQYLRLPYVDVTCGITTGRVSTPVGKKFSLLGSPIHPFSIHPFLVSHRALRGRLGAVVCL